MRILLASLVNLSVFLGLVALSLAIVLLFWRTGIFLADAFGWTVQAAPDLRLIVVLLFYALGLVCAIRLLCFVPSNLLLARSNASRSL